MLEVFITFFFVSGNPREMSLQVRHEENFDIQNKRLYANVRPKCCSRILLYM